MYKCQINRNIYYDWLRGKKEMFAISMGESQLFLQFDNNNTVHTFIYLNIPHHNSPSQQEYYSAYMPPSKI